MHDPFPLHKVSVQAVSGGFVNQTFWKPLEFQAYIIQSAHCLIPPI